MAAGRLDEEHVLLAYTAGRSPRVCALRQTYSNLFGGFASLSPNAGTSYAELSRAVPNCFVYQFMNQYNHVKSVISVVNSVKAKVYAGPTSRY